MTPERPPRHPGRNASTVWAPSIFTLHKLYNIHEDEEAKEEEEDDDDGDDDDDEEE